MEACGSAHHWGRELQELGHTVRLLPPADVARYREASPLSTLHHSLRAVYSGGCRRRPEAPGGANHIVI
jgi:transposase